MVSRLRHFSAYTEVRDRLLEKKTCLMLYYLISLVVVEIVASWRCNLLMRTNNRPTTKRQPVTLLSHLLHRHHRRWLVLTMYINPLDRLVRSSGASFSCFPWYRFPRHLTIWATSSGQQDRRSVTACRQLKTNNSCFSNLTFHRRIVITVRTKYYSIWPFRGIHRLASR